MSTHDESVGAKIRKISISLHSPVLLCESGNKGVFITWTCFPDGTGVKAKIVC